MYLRPAFVLLVTFFLSFATHARGAATYNPALHLMVYVQKGLPLSQWTHALPKGSQIIRESHPYYIVRLPRVPVEPLLEKLRKIPGIKAVYEDKLIKPTRTAHSELCPPKAQAANVQDIQELMNVAADDCDLAPSCSEDRRPALLGQMAVGGDLMLLELKRMGLSSGHTKVAVLDSGFTGSLLQQMSREPSAKYNFLEPGAQFNEGRTHGSYVTGVIGAKNGVGLAPAADIGIYRVDVNEQGDTSQALVEIQALDACRSGHKIINISFERIFTDREKPHIVRDLEAEGCMVVNSAGNSPGSGITGPDPEDGWLRVGGINTENGKSAPLETGEVNAPGFNVATLDPAAKADCMGMPMSAVSGTSLAAPIVTAILANVRGILARDPQFQALSGPDEVKLLNRIVKSSVRGGVINGLRAVLTAEAWTNAADPKPLSQEAVAGLLAKNPPDKCKQPAKNPQLDQIACAERKASINDMRFRLAACSPLPQAQLEKMIGALPRLGESHLARALSRHLPVARAEAIAQELGLNVAEEKRQEDLLQAEREGSSKEKMAAVDGLLNLQSIPASAMSAWSRQLQEFERQADKDIAEAQRRLAAFRGPNGELREDQIAALQSEIAKKQSDKACSAKWRSAMGELALSTQEYFERVATTEKEAGCSWPLNYMSEPFQEVGFGALNGTTYSEYYNGLIRQKADYQLELMLDL